MLTRKDLEDDILRKSHAEFGHKLPVLSETEFNASLDRLVAAHAPGEDVWVFGYGSLIWNPLIQYVEHRLATISGFHRSFCLRSRMGRGSVDHPGLVLGLDFGGCCKGLAYRIAAHQARNELMLIWRREMVLGSYVPRWVTARAGTTELRTLAFVVNHDHPHYAGKLPLETIIEILATAHGRFGSCADYLFKTVDCLHQHGIHDARLSALRDRVKARSTAHEHK